MSFVGQFRPILTPPPSPAGGGSRLRAVTRFGDLARFSLGFTLSATVAFWLIDRVTGGAVRKGLGTGTRVAIVVAVALGLAAVDVARLRRGDRCSLGLRRQTPQSWGYRYRLGTMLWGLDTGLPFTTVRASVLPFTCLALAGMGLARPWAGAAYAAGFCGALGVACLWPRPAGSTGGSDPTGALVERLIHSARTVRLAGLAAGTGLLAVVALTATTPGP